MKCNLHPDQIVEKITLDRYYCPVCDHDWLIHKYMNARRGVKMKIPIWTPNKKKCMRCGRVMTSRVHDICFYCRETEDQY
jgi:hypothetical protein